ncbi:hypothetical protein LJC64_03295 [Ruminococcaceae bacterium OttesenSCG-928-A11]|nr:hypothetical protein [Ruminococcaceae bacterium OttesenSCG-928-A11]
MSEKLTKNTDGEMSMDSGWESMMEGRYDAARKTGGVETTGAVVYDNDGIVVGSIPEKPTEFELTNTAEYSRSMQDTINFLDAYSFDRSRVLMREDHNHDAKRKYIFEPKHKPEYQREVDNLVSEREYLDRLSEWVGSFEDQERQEDGVYNVFDVMQKVQDDMKSNRAEKDKYIQKLNESGIDLDNPVSQRIISDYDKKHGAMFRTNKTLHKKYNKGEDLGQ